MDLTARLATDADIPTLIALRTEAEDWLAARNIDQWSSRWNEVGRAKLRAGVQRGETWIIEADSDIAATVTLNTHGDAAFWTAAELAEPVLYLYKLIVKRAYGGHDLGGIILDWACDRAAELGYIWLRFDAQRDNQRLIQYYVDHACAHLRTEQVPGRDSGALFQRPALTTPNAITTTPGVDTTTP